MRLIHCTTVHSWDDIRIFRKMAASSAASGLDVHVIALDRKASEPRKFETDGVVVHLLPGNDIRNRCQRATKGSRRVLRHAKKLAPDVLHFHDPEMLPFVALSRFDGARKIYDVHENLPAQVRSKPWIPIAVRPAVSMISDWAERLFTPFVSGIVAATPAIAERFPLQKRHIV